MKIIGSDYDGTLNHNGIDDAKREAIKKWRSAGNVFALVSGRHVHSVRDQHKEQNFACDYFVGSNGAVILNANNEVVHADCCDMDMLLPLLQYLYELGCPVGLVHSEDFFDVFPNEDSMKNLDRDYSQKYYFADNLPQLLIDRFPLRLCAHRQLCRANHRAHRCAQVVCQHRKGLLLRLFRINHRIYVHSPAPYLFSFYGELAGIMP